MKKVNKAAVERLRKFLLKEIRCGIQPMDTGGWSCGTCFMGYLTSLGLNEKAPEYAARNPEHDRHNEVWRAILQIRGDKLMPPRNSKMDKAVNKELDKLKKKG